MQIFSLQIAIYPKSSHLRFSLLLQSNKRRPGGIFGIWNDQIGWNCEKSRNETRTNLTLKLEQLELWNCSENWTYFRSCWEMPKPKFPKSCHNLQMIFRRWIGRFGAPAPKTFVNKFNQLMKIKSYCFRREIGICTNKYLSLTKLAAKMYLTHALGQENHPLFKYP